MDGVDSATMDFSANMMVIAAERALSTLFCSVTLRRLQQDTAIRG